MPVAMFSIRRKGARLDFINPVRHRRWRNIMSSHLEEILEQKKQALLKYREESLFEEIEWKKKVKELYTQIKKWLEPLQKMEYVVFK
jgi:hypothetical protein